MTRKSRLMITKSGYHPVVLRLTFVKVASVILVLVSFFCKRKLNQSVSEIPSSSEILRLFIKSEV